MGKHVELSWPAHYSGFLKENCSPQWAGMDRKYKSKFAEPLQYASLNGIMDYVIRHIKQSVLVSRVFLKMEMEKGVWIMFSSG